MKTIHRRNLLAAALVGVLTLTTTLLAQVPPVDGSQKSPPAAEDPWQFSLVPLAWVPSIRGSVTVHGHQPNTGVDANTDVSFSELENDLEGVAMLGLELRKGKFGFYAQPNWIKLEAEDNNRLLSTKDEIRVWLVDAAGFYQIAKWGEEKPVTLEALAGIRYWNIENELNLKGPNGGTLFSGSSTLSLIDPIVGLRAQIYLTRKLSLRMQGDVGGFGISNDSSDLSWQALGMVGYDFTRHFSLLAGYRALSVDKDAGTGPTQEGADIIMKGAILGLDFHW